MILHCYYCSLGGERLSPASEVAIVDAEKLCKPLRADIFQPLDPKHDPSPPFRSDEWRYMLHKACGRYPWPSVNPEDGPGQILTDQGMVQIPEAITNQVGVTDEAEVQVVSKLTCPVCGKVCKSPLGLNSHMRSHNG